MHSKSSQSGQEQNIEAEVWNPETALVIYQEPESKLEAVKEDMQQAEHSSVLKNSGYSSDEIKITGTRKNHKRTGSITSVRRRSKRQRAGKEKAEEDSQGQEFDSTRFTSHDAWSRYSAFSQDQERFIEEREIVLEKSDPIRKLIDGMKMLATVSSVKPFDPDVVLEFWANFPKGKSENGIKEVLVRDWMYEFSASRINKLYGLKDVDERTHKVNFAGVLDDEVASFVTGGKVKDWESVSYSLFKTEYKQLYKICCSNWLPTKNDAYPKLARAKLIYMIAHKIPFNYGILVYDHICQVAWSTQAKFKFPFPSLIQQLLDAQHQVIRTKAFQGCQKTKSKSSSSKDQVKALRAEMKKAMTILQEALNAGMFSCALYSYLTYVFLTYWCSQAGGEISESDE